MIRLAIFDMDGTLLDTLTDLTNSSNHALTAAGFPPCTAEQCAQALGRGSWNLIKRLLPEADRDEETTGRVHGIFRSYYEIHGQDKTRPYPGTTEMLRAVREAGINTAILSNKPHAYTEPLTERYFPGLIDFALGQREGVPIKPDPSSMREILNHFGVTESECAYVGDSEVDILTGINAGVFTVGVSWGFRTTEQLLEAGAVVIVHKVEDLTPVIVDKAGKAAIY